MEKPKKTGKQKMPIAIGGGGVVGGVIVWGGMVAIATFVSVSAIKLRKKRSLNKSQPPPPPIPSTDVSNKLELNNKNDDEGKGLRVLLQDCSPPTDHHISRDGITEMSPTQIDSTSLDMEDKPVLDLGGGNEKPTYLDVLLRDNSKPKSNELVIDYGEAIEKSQADQFAEANPQMQLMRKEPEEVQFEIEGEIEICELMREDKAIKAEEPMKEEEEGYGIEEVIGERLEAAIETFQKDQFAVEVDMEEIEVMKDEAAIVVPDACEIEEDKNPQMELIEEDKETDDGGGSAEKEDREVEAIEDDPQVRLSEEEDNQQVRLSEEEDNPQVQLIEDREEEEIETIEDDPRAILSEEEDDEDEDEEGITERGGESSEGTGDSSIESNAEAIWPAESIEELSEEIKEFTINAQKQEEKIYEYRTSTNGHHNNEDTGKSVTSSSKIRTIKEFLMGINKSTANLGIWIWSVSVVVVLLLVVAPLLLSPANIVKICLIIFLVAILSHV
ncbi:FK506-binding nuclear protein [Actinidia chinensis var. chinensis]|uniref:FK506-binding nuclear protein n=1 Tax=Actinidia chinensis var. chinensis TaxID=1590841 RepID=A0A2R6PNU9_ACTCC|nr:FK506-binding nuclear protein [Actinidia chinensis var. chinensis]